MSLDNLLYASNQLSYSTKMGGRQRSVVSVSERSGTLWSDFARPQRQLTLANVFRKGLPRRVGVGEMKALIEQSEALGNAQQQIYIGGVTI
jgi:hypothetical protein